MKNQTLLDHIRKYNEEHDYRCETPDDYLETLHECGKELYRETANKRRWCNEVFYVVELSGKEIGFYDAETTGDISSSGIGWEFDLSLICEVEKHERTEVIVTYKPIK